MPFGVKDVIWEAGVETTDGSRSLLGFFPDESARCVRRLVAAGAIVVGRTNQPEFCYRGISENPLYGATSNPWDVGRTPGGSSGGSASAVAAGLVPIAIGTDGRGSVRIPASFCGIAGIKGTHGLVPREPQLPGWYTLSSVGPLAFTVADCALMLSVMAGVDPGDPISLPASAAELAAAADGDGDLRGRASLLEGIGYIRIDRAYAPASARRSSDPGAWPPSSSRRTRTSRIRSTPGTPSRRRELAFEGHLLETGHDRPGQGAELIEAGAAYSGLDYLRARNDQAAYGRGLGVVDGGLRPDADPAMELVAFPHGTTPGDHRRRADRRVLRRLVPLQLPVHLSGQPAMSVPMAAAEEGRPVGLRSSARALEGGSIPRAAAAWSGSRRGHGRFAPAARAGRGCPGGPAYHRGRWSRGRRAGADSPEEGELVVEVEPASRQSGAAVRCRL